MSARNRQNGHLGLNEPTELLEPFCHISVLEEKTRHHDMLKTAGSRVTHGITLGLKDILNAKEILLLIAGEGKHDAVEKYLAASVTTTIPASFPLLLLFLLHFYGCTAMSVA